MESIDFGGVGELDEFINKVMIDSNTIWRRKNEESLIL